MAGNSFPEQKTRIIDDASNFAIYDVNMIANPDKAVIPYLDLPTGTQLERIKGTNQFQITLAK